MGNSNAGKSPHGTNPQAKSYPETIVKEKDDGEGGDSKGKILEKENQDNLQNPLGVLHAFMQTHTQIDGEIERDDDDGESFNILK